MKYLNKELILFLYSFFFNAFCILAQVNSQGLPEHIILNVTEDMTTSMAVNWRTDSTESISKIQFAKENSMYNIGQDALEILANSEELRYKDVSHWYHAIVLRDLLPNTMYAYRVGNGSKWSEWMNFKTASKDNSPLKFIYFGDVQSSIKSLWSRVAKKAIRELPESQFIVYGGDIVNRGNNLNEWEDWFAATGGVHQNVPIMPASGNHDHGDDSNNKYGISVFWNKQFNLPKNGIESLTETSYFVNIQNVKFIFLNTEMFNTDESIKKDQVKWLEDVLKSNKEDWIILVMHHPIYSTKRNRDNIELREAIKPLIDKYNIDLVLQGHDHTYARGKDNIPMKIKEKSNATYIVSVAGPKMSDVLEADWMDVSHSHMQLFQTIEIDRNELFFKAFKVNGEIVDSFVITKKDGVNYIKN